MLRICLRIFHPLLHRFPVAQILQPLQPLGLHCLLPQGLLTLRQGPLILPLHLRPGRPPPDPIRIQFSVLWICLRIFHLLLHRFPVAQILQPLQPLGLHHLLPQGLLTLRQGPPILPLHLRPGRPPRTQFGSSFPCYGFTGTSYVSLAFFSSGLTSSGPASLFPPSGASVFPGAL